MEVEQDLTSQPRRRAHEPSHVVADADAAAQVTGPEWVRRWAREKPHALAVVDGADGRTEHLSWQELDTAADQAATVLLHQGVQPGDRVAVQLPNCREFVIT